MLFFKATGQQANVVRKEIMSFEKGTCQLISNLNVPFSLAQPAR
jgi:hypothetical protein